jgi:hypothetical protein
MRDKMPLEIGSQVLDSRCLDTGELLAGFIFPTELWQMK